MKKTILFCYFAPDDKTYTPLDWGYVVTMMKKQKALEGCSVRIVQLNHKGGKAQDLEYYKKTAYYLKSYNPDAVFFSLESIVWSKVYGLGGAIKIAKNLRDIDRDIFLGVQSYKISDKEAEQVLSDSIFDSVVHKDPEYSFQYLDRILRKESVPGVSFYDEKKVGFSKTSEGDYEKEKKLDYIPSPYLEGVFDVFYQKKQLKFEGKFTGYVCSCRGCPFGCYYCYRSVKFESMRYFSPERIYDELEYGVNRFGLYRYFFIDDCFLTSKQRLKDLVAEFEKRKKKNSKLENLYLLIMSRPELIDEEVVELFHRLNIKYVQIGLQTVNPKIQKYMTRASKIEDFKKISDWFKKYEIHLKLDVIIGLPGDTIEYFKKTLDYAVDLDPGTLQVKQLYHNPETKFYNDFKDYDIFIEEEERDFSVPYVSDCEGVDQKYQKQAYEYIIKKKGEFPKIYWKWLSQYGAYYDERK